MPALPSGPAIAARTACTASSMLSPLDGPVMLTLNTAAFPSGEDSSGPGAAMPETSPANPATAVRAAASAAWSAGVSPLSRAATTIAVSVCDWPPRCACCTSATFVEAAAAGR